MAGPPRQAATAPRSRNNLLRCVILTAVALVVAVGLALLIIWLVIRPAPLEYTVEEGSIRNFNLTGDDRLNSTFSLRLMADNRNKKVSVYYDWMEVSVWYDDQALASAEHAPFYQPTRNATRVAADAVARGAPLLSGVAKGLRRDRSSGKVALEVRVEASIRFEIAGLKSRHYTLRVYCSPVIIYFNNKTPFQRSYCDVEM